MKRVGHILTGWGKALGLVAISSAEAKLSELRMRACSSCPFSKQSKLLEIINDEAIQAEQLVCTSCHCPVLQKTLVIDETCPVGKW